MNILYLLKTLNTTKLSELVAHIEAPPIDVNLAIWGAIDRGEIEVDEKKNKVKALKTSDNWHDPELAKKLLAVISHYADNKVNITRGRLVSEIKDPTTMQGYPLHEYLMTLQYMIDNDEVLEFVLSVPEIKNKRPYHRFVFLCLQGNDNEEWNAKAVNSWIKGFEKSKKKK